MTYYHPHPPVTEDEWVCATCRRPLDAFQAHDADGILVEHRWQHTLYDAAQDRDHEPTPVRLKDTGGEIVGVCDFCTAPHPTWEYPCESFHTGIYGSVGGWGACDDCHHLIATGQWARLANRAAASQPTLDKAQARKWAADLHRAFMRHRTGDPTPC